MFKKLLLIFAIFSSNSVYAFNLVNLSPSTDNKFMHPFYVGLHGGYGSTTWNGLVPVDGKQNDAVVISTPLSVNEGGAVWGAMVGYEIIPVFAIELGYTHYPEAKVFFDPSSLVTFKHDGLTRLKTHTDTLSFMAKFMIFIPGTDIRAYSSAGVARIHRDDQLRELSRLGPTFGVGLIYNFTDRIMGELGFNYVGGYGESELDPSEDFVPFLYSGFVQLAYRFG